MLALTYGVRQQSVTLDALTKEFGLDVGLRKIPARRTPRRRGPLAPRSSEEATAPRRRRDVREKEEKRSGRDQKQKRYDEEETRGEAT